ncbi:MAG: hypothetical protein NVS4B8_06530 [Herpetosiphon sp.]
MAYIYHLPTMGDPDVITALRQRKARWFLADDGPPIALPGRARWRYTPQDPQGWQANMVGCIDAPASALGSILDRAVAFFGRVGADTAVDVDEYSPLWSAPQLLHERGFRVSDNLVAMNCRRLRAPVTGDVSISMATEETDLYQAAWLSEQGDIGHPLPWDAPLVVQRFERYRTEAWLWNTRFVIGRVRGEVAGTARLTDEAVPVVVGVSTLPWMRGQGVATAMSASLTGMALEQAPTVALFAQRCSQAERIYRRLGYKLLYQNQVWVRPYDQDC